MKKVKLYLSVLILLLFVQVSFAKQGRSAKEMVQKYQTELKLTADQVSKATKIFEGMIAQKAALEKKYQGEELKQNFKKVRGEYMEKFKALLTPEQVEMMKAAKAEHKNKEHKK